MADISEILERLESLESEVKNLKKENKALKKGITLESFTEAMRMASEEQVQSWYDLCQERANELGLLSESTDKRKKAPKKATNSEGPREWNIFVQSTWQDMLAEAGVEVPEDDAEFKKVAKKAGISYQAAMKEAGIRKRAMEKGISKKDAEKEMKEENKEKKSKKSEKTESAPKTPSKKISPVAPNAPKKAEKVKEEEKEESEPESGAEEEEEDEELAKSLEDAGFVEMKIQGCLWYVDKENLSVYTRPEKYVLGDCVGTYDASTETIEYC